MSEIRTDELEKILMSIHPTEVKNYAVENSDEFLNKKKPFAAYMSAILHEKKLLWQDVFIQADISEKYGYKLIEEQERTKQRDLILRICYAAHFTLLETQHALTLYGFAELTTRSSRDMVLMIAFNTRPGSILDVNHLLREHHEKTLRFYPGLE